MVLAVACAIFLLLPVVCLAGEGVEYVDGAMPAQSYPGSGYHIVEFSPFGQDARHGEQSLRVSMGLQRERANVVVVFFGMTLQQCDSCGCILPGTNDAGALAAWMKHTHAINSSVSNDSCVRIDEVDVKS